MIKKSVLILGAKSDIGMAVARRFACHGYNIQLAARASKSLENDRCDIQIQFDVDVTIHEFDVLCIETHADFVSSLPKLPDIAVCAVGYMGNQSKIEFDTKEASLVMRSNFEGPTCVFSILADLFEVRSSGVLIGISSCAGERGRAKNYVYGAAKAGFSAFLSGLRNRLFCKGVHVVTVLPGFVDTKMTKALSLPKPVTVDVNTVAKAVYKASMNKKNVVYVGWYWRYIMWLVKNIPEAIFKKINI